MISMNLMRGTNNKIFIWHILTKFVGIYLTHSQILLRTYMAVESIL